MTKNKRKKEVSGLRMVAGYLGLFLVMVGILTAMPLIVLAFYPSEWKAAISFVFPVGFDIVVGLILYFAFIFKRSPARFQRHEDSLLLVLVWLMALISGAAPFFIASQMGDMSMTFSQSIFEATGCYTTTGLTVFHDYLDVPGAFCPHVFTFHRAFMQFIGGVGFVLLLTSILGGGVSLYLAEGHADKLLPSIGKSAKLIFGIYFMYTTIGTVALMFAGMPVFEALCHAMAALPCGGVSPRQDNIASYRAFEGQVMEGGLFPVSSIAIEIIIMALVCLAAVSFVLHTFLLRGKWGKFFRDDEIRYMIASAIVAVVVAFFGSLTALYSSGSSYFDNAGHIFRDDIFYVVASFTNSGFGCTTSSMRYHLVEGGDALSLGKPLIIVCTVMMCIGAGSGSCGGGIKQYRIVVLLRHLYYSVRYKFALAQQENPKVTYRYGEIKELSDDVVKEAHDYTLLYLAVFILASIALCFCEGYGPETAAFDMASAISNTGLGLVIGHSYVTTANPVSANAAMWILSVVMFLGRLEIMPIAYANVCFGEEALYHKAMRERKRREEALLHDDF